MRQSYSDTYCDSNGHNNSYCYCHSDIDCYTDRHGHCHCYSYNYASTQRDTTTRSYRPAATYSGSTVIGVSIST